MGFLNDIFGGGDAPEYPTEQMDRQLDLSERAQNRYFDLSEQQQQWAQDIFGDQMWPLLERVLGAQGSVMQEQLSNARKDRARYEQVYQPLEDALIKEFEEYDSPERRRLEAGRAMATVQQSFDAQRANAEQRLASFGVDPSQIRAGAIDRQARNKMALAQAQQGNMARQRVEDTGRSLRAEAINIGRGLPSNVAGAYGQTLNAGNSMQGNMNSTVGQGANIMGTGTSWGQMGGNQLGQTMGGLNSMYSGQLAQYMNEGGMMGALGNIGGQMLGGWAAGGFQGFEGGGAVGQLPDDNYSQSRGAEGGGQQAIQLENSDAMPTPGPNDKIPLQVAENEYIIPADVAIYLGTEKLDSIVEKARQKSGERGGANTNTPVGELPNPEPPVKGQTLAAEGGGAVGYIPPTEVDYRAPVVDQSNMNVDNPFDEMPQEKRQGVNSGFSQGLNYGNYADMFGGAGGQTAGEYMTSIGAPEAAGADWAGVYGGGAEGAAGGESAIAAAGPWAALAAAIVGNETWAREKGRRANSWGSYAGDIATGKVLEQDMDALGGEIDNYVPGLGTSVSWMGKQLSPEGSLEQADDNMSDIKDTFQKIGGIF